MVSRLSRAVQAARDIVLLVFSAVLIGSSYGRWVQELVFLVLFIFGATLFTRSAINLALVAKNVRRKAFFYANSIVQLPITFILAGLLPVVGVPLLILNIVILVTLRRKTVEQPQAQISPQPATSASEETTKP